MELGFTTTSFRQIKDLEKITEIAKSIGADCIEWGGDIHVKSIADAEAAKKFCDNSGIRINSYGSYYRVGSRKKDDWLNICRISDKMNARSVRVWLGTADSEKTDSATYETLVEDIRDMCTVADNFGLIVCPECHDNTFNNSTDAFLRIKKDADCTNFLTYFQSRYCKKQYDLDRIERTFPYIETVHLSYFEQVREQFPKRDYTYIDTLLDKLLELGFDKNILIEYTFFSYNYGIIKSMEKDMKRLKAKLNK